jgi:hypothetical protein
VVDPTNVSPHFTDAEGCSAGESLNLLGGGVLCWREP